MSRTAGRRPGAPHRAVVVGSGPNGLAAAVILARAGLRVTVYEAQQQVGGGAATTELMLSGFRHDLCSAIHPAALSSPFFRAFGLRERVDLKVPEISFAHPLEGRPAALLHRDIGATARGLGIDGPGWVRLLGPLVERHRAVESITGAQLLRIPEEPLALLRLGRAVAELASPWRDARFIEERAPALITGTAAHSVSHPRSPAFVGAGLKLLVEAHAQGWPVPVGGSGAITDALVQDLLAHGGEVVPGTRVDDLRELPNDALIMLDVTPRAFLGMAPGRLPSAYAAALRRYRPGPGSAKVDLATDAPIPWLDPSMAGVVTVHLGGTAAQIRASERAVLRGEVSDRPYVLLAQPSLLDPTRAPQGKHVVWAYLHVPPGSTLDATAVVVKEVERHAPGFRETILASSARSARQMEQHNANYIGGDILGGAVTVRQLVRRPVLSTAPWRTPLSGVYLCSASTPPGPAVHGLCGMYAARTALSDHLGMVHLPDLSPTPEQRTAQTSHLGPED